MARITHIVGYDDPSARVLLMMCGSVCVMQPSTRRVLIPYGVDYVPCRASNRATCITCLEANRSQVIYHRDLGYLKLVVSGRGLFGEWMLDIDRATLFPNIYEAYQYLRVCPEGAEITPL